MDLYFAYGSNMSTARLRSRVGDAQPLGRAFVDGWRLAFDKPGRDGTGKANLVETASARTWGVLFELPADAWSALDRFEPGYVRNEFRFARCGGEDLLAHTYVFARSDATEPTGPPSDAYLAHVLAGAREHDLPAEHIRLIESFHGR